MKKNVLLVALSLTLFCGNLFAQSKAQRAELERISSEWEIDDNENLTYIRVIDNLGLPQDELYNRALSFFTYNYNVGSDVTQVTDKEAGRIVGKGIYENFEKYTWMMAVYGFSADHYLRVDIKDERVRIILSAQNYDCVMNDAGRITRFKVAITKSYPVDEESTIFKKMYTKTFLSLHARCQKTLDSFEKSLKEGNTFSGVENSDW